MELKATLFSVIATIALAGCSNAREDEAARLGFSSADEMEEVHAKGWHTQAQYMADERARAKQFGFIDVDELHRADAAGVKTKSEYRKYLADLDKRNEEFSKEEAAREAAESGERSPSTAVDALSRSTENSYPNSSKQNAAKLLRLSDSGRYCSSIDSISDSYSKLVSKKIGVRSGDIEFIGSANGTVKGLNLCSVNLSTPIGVKKCSVSEIYSSDGGRTAVAFPSDNEIKFDYLLCE